MKQVIYDLRKLIWLQFIFSILWTLTNVCLPYMNMILFDHVGHLTLKLVIFVYWLFQSYFGKFFLQVKNSPQHKENNSSAMYYKIIIVLVS